MIHSKQAIECHSALIGSRVRARVEELGLFNSSDITHFKSLRSGNERTNIANMSDSTKKTQQLQIYILYLFFYYVIIIIML